MGDGHRGTKPLTQFQSCIGSESSVSSRFFLGIGSGPFLDIDSHQTLGVSAVVRRDFDTQQTLGVSTVVSRDFDCRPQPWVWALTAGPGAWRGTPCPLLVSGWSKLAHDGHRPLACRPVVGLWLQAAAPVLGRHGGSAPHPPDLRR